MAQEKIQQSIDELNEHFVEQLGFLNTSADSYDKGLDGEAKRLAVTLRVLLHDTRNSQSLLKQLNKLSGKFISTVIPYDDSNIASYSGLVKVGMSGEESRFIAMLDQSSVFRWVPFQEWWEEIVFVDNDKNKFTRKDIILNVADKDGGAHVDPSLDKTYAKLSRHNSLGWTYLNENESKPVTKPERAAIRQIAHEVLRTFLPDYSKIPIFKEAIVIGNMKIKEASFAMFEKEMKRMSIRNVDKIGRNDLCPCGSNEKFKKCHGPSWKYDEY